MHAIGLINEEILEIFPEFVATDQKVKQKRGNIEEKKRRQEANRKVRVFLETPSGLHEAYRIEQTLEDQKREYRGLVQRGFDLQLVALEAEELEMDQDLAAQEDTLSTFEKLFRK